MFCAIWALNSASLLTSALDTTIKDRFLIVLKWVIMRLQGIEN